MTNKIFAYSFKVTDATTGEVRGPVNRYSTRAEAAKHARKHPAAIVTAEIGLAELAALRAENEKLRAALQSLRPLAAHTSPDDVSVHAARAALAALAGKGAK